MKSKNEVADKLQQYLDEFYVSRGITLQTIQTDNDSCFAGQTLLLLSSKNKFRKLCASLNIQLRHSSPYCHWENGVAERVIRTMMEKSFTIMAQRDIDSRHWEHCLAHVCKVNNMLPHSAFADEETPYFRWFEKIPSGKYLQIFGSDVRINTPLDNNPKPRKYIDPPGHIAKYIGFTYDSVAHLCWNYQKFQTRQNPIERVGNDQCKFFRMLNPKLFVIPHNDPAYAMYLPDDVADLMPDSDDKTILPPKNGIRIAKSFGKKEFFGTATKNVGGKFCYDVVYDDGDFEHFDVDEFSLHTEQFRDSPMTPSKQIESEIFSTVTNFTKINSIINHKIVYEHNVYYAALECVVTRHGGELSAPLWLQLGALIKSNTDAEIREHNWTTIVNYLKNTDNIVEYPVACVPNSLFQLVTVNPSSARSNRRVLRHSMLGSYVEPDNGDSVTCVLPVGTHFTYASTELKSVVVHSLRSVPDKNNVVLVSKSSEPISGNSEIKIPDSSVSENSEIPNLKISKNSDNLTENSEIPNIDPIDTFVIIRLKKPRTARNLTQRS